MGDAHDGPVRKCSIPYADLKPCLMNVSLTFDRVVIAYQTIMNLVYMAYVLVPIVRRVWRYQRGNQNPYIEEEQTTQ